MHAPSASLVLVLVLVYHIMYRHKSFGTAIAGAGVYTSALLSDTIHVFPLQPLTSLVFLSQLVAQGILPPSCALLMMRAKDA